MADRCRLLGPEGALPRLARRCFPAQPHLRGPEWRWLGTLLTAGALVLLLLVLAGLLIWPFDRHSDLVRRWNSCERHRPAMEVDVLPPMPEDVNDMLQALFSYLARPKARACKRDIAIGGVAIFRDGNTSVLWGAKHVCLDPEFSLADEQCLVYSLRQASDASFDDAAEAFGCEVHSFGPESARPGPVRHHAAAPEQALAELDQHVDRLGHRRRPLGYLALALDAPALARLLDAPPRALADNVRQLGVRLDVRALTTGRGGRSAVELPDVPGLRRLYEALLRLQRFGFYPFSFDVLDLDEIKEFRVGELPDAVPDEFEVAWVKTRCTADQQ